MSNRKDLPVTRHVKKADHSNYDIECVTFKNNFPSNTGTLIQEKTLHHTLKTDTHGFNQDSELVAHNTYFLSN